jgi:hypothetical protein
VDMHNSCVLVNETKLKVDLTKYAERHQFNFDESLDEYVDNDQVSRQHRSHGQSQVGCEKAYSGCTLASMQRHTAHVRLHISSAARLLSACCSLPG